VCIDREGIRFVAVGVVNTADYYAIFLLLDRVTWYLLAHVVAFVGSSCGSFFLNCRFTYRVQPTWRKFFLFPLTVGVNFAVTTAALAARRGVGLRSTSCGDRGSDDRSTVHIPVVPPGAHGPT
jgi:putative flippase GtrA